MLGTALAGLAQPVPSVLVEAVLKARTIILLLSVRACIEDNEHWRRCIWSD